MSHQCRRCKLRSLVRNNADYRNAGTRWLLGENGNAAYERFIAGRVAEEGLEKNVFAAKAGEVFLWHANLLHGGEPQRDMRRTRQSTVLHYLSKGHVVYHETSRRPALIDE